jgi:hypothetical protein
VKQDDDIAKQMRHLSIKYCKNCAKIAQREKAKERQKRYRRRRRKGSEYDGHMTFLQKRELKALREYCGYLEEVNAILNRKLDERGV